MEPVTHRLPLVRPRLLVLVGRLVALCLVLTLAGPAWADGDKAAAESLFQDGKAAMKQGKYEQACTLFTASFDAEPSVGALLNLALNAVAATPDGGCVQLVARGMGAGVELCIVDDRGDKVDGEDECGAFSWA